MNQEELITIALFMSRLPLYLYVIWKMWGYRNSMIVIPSRWLGITAVLAVVGASINMPYLKDGHAGIKVLVGYLFTLALFYTAYKSRQAKPHKERQ